MKYICEKCNKQFSQKSNYMTHLNRKNSCVKTNIKKSYICMDCNAKFTQKCNLNRHMKYNCTKNIKNVIDHIDNEIDELKAKNFEMENKINELLEQNKIL